MTDPTELPMFPLGSVLFPAMPLPLRVFEPRYVEMLRHVLTEEPAEFGVVLIERGHEVGGGEQRFGYGTVARIVQIGAGEEFVTVRAEGRERIEVVEWLEDDPFPRALVRSVDELEWDVELEPRREQTEDLVRRTLARASEFEDQMWSATVELADDPITFAWQLAGIAPVGPLDQVALLRSTTMRGLLDAIFTATTEAAEVLEARGSW